MAVSTSYVMFVLGPLSAKRVWPELCFSEWHVWLCSMFKVKNIIVLLWVFCFFFWGGDWLKLMLIFSRLPLTKHFKTQPVVRWHSLKGEYLVKLLGFHQDKKAFLHRRNWWCLEENHKLISHKEPVLGASSTDSISCP